MFSFFEAPALKKAKKAAQAAGLLRQQAADKLTSEMAMMSRFQGVAADRWNKLLVNSHGSSLDLDISAIRKAEDLKDRVARLSWTLQELHDKHNKAMTEKSAVSYDEVQSFELELRDAFATLLQETTGIVDELQELNAKCAALSDSHNEMARVP